MEMSFAADHLMNFIWQGLAVQSDMIGASVTPIEVYLWKRKSALNMNSLAGLSRD